MKTIRIIVLSFLALIIVGAIAGGAYIRYTSRKALPDYNKSTGLQSLGANVTVIRDKTAMPHLYAESEVDLYRATGYCMAQDRLWQMDLLRRLTTGRLSEIFGKDLVEVDQLFRSLRFTEKSAMVIDSCDAEVIMCLEAFADGVNQYIADHNQKLPPEFTVLGYKPEKWEVIHSANLIGYMAWGLTMAWNTEISLFKLGQEMDKELFRELIPDMDIHRSYIYPDSLDKELSSFTRVIDDAKQTITGLGLQVFQASNNWAVSPEKSESGHALLANDMHLELNAPGIWYQMHQVVPGKVNVTGVALPGAPFVICGHNEDVAWGMTNVMLDDMDFYLETVSDDSSAYLYNGEWRDFQSETELIATKEGDTIEVTNRFTHRGPVISKFKGLDDHVVSMRWIGNEYSNELQSVYQFNRMSNWSDFREAAETFIAISQNIAYADKNGNIGMQTTAGVPLRKGEGIFLAPGDTSLYDWTGILDFEKLPYSYNPSSGYVASANNRTIADDYPYYISRWFDLPNRFERITEFLESDDKLSVEDFKTLQSDQKSKWAEKLVPYFTGLLAGGVESASDEYKQAYALLSAWDFEMDPESVEATIFERFYVDFLYYMFSDELGEELFNELIKEDLLAAYLIEKIRLTNESAFFDNVNTDKIKETPEEIAMNAFQATIDSLRLRLGDETDQWKWGRVHTLTLEHPLGSVNILNRAFKLNKGPYPVGGSYHTVSPFSYPLTDLYKANHGSSHRHIFVAGDWDRSQVIIPTGISGIPASKYYCDQTDDYLDYIYKTDFFSETEVRNSQSYQMMFFPEKIDE